MQETCVYIDGFNLYYGAVKNTPYRWLDLAQLCRRMLPTNDVERINYYTALVGARNGDPGQPIRQKTSFAIWLRCFDQMASFRRTWSSHEPAD